MTDITPVIEIKDLKFSYTPGETIVECPQLTVNPGQSGCIVGPNGGGKTTLLRILLGLLKPESGMVRVFGKNSAEATRYIGYMPQYHQLDPAFPVSALEVTLMGRISPATIFGYKKADKTAALDALAELGIADLADKSFASLSGGQRQRVLIARALAGDPKLLLLDEPTANIDPGAEEQFYATLDNLRRRMTVITVSHDLGFVNKETDLIICVNRQVVLHSASKFTAEAADEIYHHHMNMIQHSHSCFCGCEEHQCHGDSSHHE